jgi:hypothetical protein
MAYKQEPKSPVLKRCWEGYSPVPGKKKEEKGSCAKSPAKIKDAAYEKSNRKMRSKYTKETGKTLGKRHLTGTSPRRVSFACRFAGMAGAMKDKKGEPTRKAMALKKWGFGSVGAASSFCQKNKKS